MTAKDLLEFVRQLDVMREHHVIPEGYFQSERKRLLDEFFGQADS